MTLFRLDASIRDEGSNSRALATTVEESWRQIEPETEVIRRDVGLNPLASTDWANLLGAWPTPEDSRTPEQQGAVSTVTELVDELAAADCYIFAVPLYNFGVSQHFKTYVDLVQTDPRMANPETLVTRGKSGVLVTVQGGFYGPGTPKDGWDHSTAWMQRILQDVWEIDITVVSRAFTLVGVNPALDEFTDMATQFQSDATGEANTAGRWLSPQPVA